MENDFNPNEYPDYRATDMALQQEFEEAMAEDELTQDDIDTLTHEKRVEEAEQADRSYE